MSPDSRASTTPLTRRRTLAALAGATLAAATAPAAAAESDGRHRPRTIRFATFNSYLNRGAEGQLLADLEGGADPQIQAVAEIIQRVDPDVLLLNEFDYVPAGAAVRLLQRNYLRTGHHGAPGVHFPYFYAGPVNTGVPSGVDLDGKNGAVTEPGSDAYGQDAYGYGFFPGQYGMAVLSKYPLDLHRMRSFRTFRWADMPGNRIPADYYSPQALEVLRLSSKSHWDIPVRLGGGRTVHLLASHPTPPAFDGPEQRNHRRNYDEVRLWADYIAGGRQAAYLYDDAGRRGGLARGARFVIAGDQNSDPYDGDGSDAIRQLLASPRLHPLAEPPASSGGVEAAKDQGGANAGHRGDPRYDTADFADSGNNAPGNLRVDYVLPSRGLTPAGNGVFWPDSGDDLRRLVGDGYPVVSSDHRLVWQDVRW
ncbi:endonuclease/exonuclease/phosphatase family protein [Streptomyces sp. A7024]|uniref:Endonuclease/exonuclease/phosphatase family protein n=1 Tax=Streptomyces coryli TaxID=1128680 RepID=A0A6G4U7Z4_9ACTN|nr:endonuclease/exonuclease/phosphatase family protein [Streptomyces coryli]NGN68122.1 endonuclease/exonuclease/phosphatase family protein [Streptomyces coryli]